jgi:hypothetical protein
MKTLQLIGHVDENHRLSLEVPADVKPGPVRVIVQVADPEEEEVLAWEQAVNEDWAKEWSDPREDIYTLEDGKPVNEPR